MLLPCWRPAGNISIQNLKLLLLFVICLAVLRIVDERGRPSVSGNVGTLGYSSAIKYVEERKGRYYPRELKLTLSKCFLFSSLSLVPWLTGCLMRLG